MTDPTPHVLSIDVGRKNLALCLVRPGACPKGREDVIEQWCVTTCDPTPHGIAVSLRLLPWCTTCSEVVIERQPNRNPTMSRLQHYLEMYFVMHDKPVTVQDAKHKLAFAAGTPWWPAQPCDGWSYYTRKKLSVQTTKAFLDDTSQDESFNRLFESTSKKDDLGDCLLQGMAFCHHVRPLELTKRALPQPRLRARKPTDKQLASGKFSKPNIAHFLRACKTQDAVRAKLAKEPKLAKSVDRQFGGVEPLLQALRI